MKEEGRLVAKICDFGLARKLRKNHEDRVNSSFMASPSLRSSLALPNGVPLSTTIFNQIKQGHHKSTSGVLSPSSMSHNRSTNKSTSMTSLAGRDSNAYECTSPEYSTNPRARIKQKRMKKRDKNRDKKRDKKDKEETPESHLMDEMIPEMNAVEQSVVDEVDRLDMSHMNSLGGTMASITKRTGDSLDALTTECGTVAYMAPELLEHLNVNISLCFLCFSTLHSVTFRLSMMSNINRSPNTLLMPRNIWCYIQSRLMSIAMDLFYGNCAQSRFYMRT